MAVAPTPVAAAPDAPDRAQRATFSARATAFFDWIKNTFVAGVNALASNVYANAQDAASSAANAVAQSASATAQAGIATAQAAAATSAAATATTQAGVATTQAASITTAAATSTEKAAVATAKAAEATAAAATATAVTLGVATGYPIIRPSLTLDFANSQIFDPRITFTRASSATRVNEKGLIESVAANMPRIDFGPVTGACKGLPIEEQRTNLLTYSEQFDNAYWSKSGLTVSSNATVAPDGTFTADKLVEASSSQYNYIYRNRTASNETVTASVYVKEAGRKYVKIQFTDNVAYVANAVFDLNSGVIFSTSSPNAEYSGITSSIQGVGSGWYRVSLTATKASINPDNVLSYFIVSDNGVTVLYTGDGTSGLYIWGTQLEAASFPTTYIPSTVTHTGRASTATFIGSNGLIQTAASGVARYSYNPANLSVAPALLLETAATNLLTYSEQFDNAAWVKNNSSISSNTVTAPDGTLTADRLAENTSNTTHSLYQVSAVVSGTTYTQSAFFKAGERTKCALSFNSNDSAFVDAQSVFDLSLGTVVSSNAENAGIIPLGNGWYRCWSVKTATATANSIREIRAYAASEVYTGDGTSGLNIWGAQLEAGTFPSSYIPTTTAQVTRAADTSTSAATTRAGGVATMTGANFASWYRQDEGTFVAFARRDALSPGRLITLSDGTSGNQICITLIVSSTSLRADLEVTVGGVLQVATTTTPVFAVGSMFAIAFVYKANDFAISVNGTTVVTDTSGAVPIVDRVHIGTDRTGANSHNGTVARIAYYPVKLSPSQLQALTS
jgi:hypothetical protein